MPTISANERNLKKLICEQLYVDMDLSIEECAKMTGLCIKTIYRWINKEDWNARKAETQVLEKQIAVNLKRALNQALKRFTLDPSSKDMTNLIALLKQFKEQHKPNLAYKDNILKFLDHTVDFLLQTGMEDLTNGFKSILVKLAEYLIQR